MIGANSGLAQKDPGPRPGPAAAGSFYPTLNAYEQGYFTGAQSVFQEVESVTGSDNVGLGPAFNGNSCAQCHAEPAMGGSSPGTRSKINPVPNPQVALATLEGAQNTVPSFITVNGPVREARFIRQPDGSADGGVHDLFTIAGRSDAPGCTLAQPNFAQALQANNVIYRIPDADLWPGIGREHPGFGAAEQISPPRRRNGRRCVSRAPSIPAATMAPSRALAGRRRTNRW